MLERLLSSFSKSYERNREDFEQQWRVLANKSEIAFNWPKNCPLEVIELIGRERFNAQSPKYMLPFFWKSEPTPATRSWGVIVCCIEWMFGVICLLLNVLHFSIYLPHYEGGVLPGYVLFITLIELSVFFAVKALFMISLLEKWIPLLKKQLVVQYATCVILIINVSLTVAADSGGYDEKNLYAAQNPTLIRIAAFFSFIFIFVQFFLLWITVSVYTFLRDAYHFKKAIENSMLRYRKRVFFSYCSIVFEETKKAKLLLRSRGIGDEIRSTFDPAISTEEERNSATLDVCQNLRKKHRYRGRINGRRIAGNAIGKRRTKLQRSAKMQNRNVKKRYKYCQTGEDLGIVSFNESGITIIDISENEPLIAKSI